MRYRIIRGKDKYTLSSFSLFQSINEPPKEKPKVGDFTIADQSAIVARAGGERIRSEARTSESLAHAFTTARQAPMPLAWTSLGL